MLKYQCQNVLSTFLVHAGNTRYIPKVVLTKHICSGSGGLVGEITMVQLYEVALTAGKAHKDHKHHHGHHYEHDTTNNTPRPTRPPVTGRPLPQHPYLTAGQINHQVWPTSRYTVALALFARKIPIQLHRLNLSDCR